MRTRLMTVKGLAAGAVGVVLAAGVAGAAANSFDVESAATSTTVESDDSTTTTAATTTTTDATTTTTIEVESKVETPEAAIAEEPAAPPVSIECAEGNHGKTVSSVAKATPSGPGKGAIVSAAAQSDCGKKVKDGSTDDESSDVDDDASDVDEDQSADLEDDSDDDDGDDASGPQGKAKGHDKAGKPGTSKDD